MDVLIKEKGDDEGQKFASDVHIRVQQRNGRKCITTVTGLAEDLDQKRILRYFKKMVISQV